MLMSMLCWAVGTTRKRSIRTGDSSSTTGLHVGRVSVRSSLWSHPGRTNPGAHNSFFTILPLPARGLSEAFVGGVIFNAGNLLLVAAISIAAWP